MKTTSPDTDSIEELARFWQAHDLTDFTADLEEPAGPVFERSREQPVTVYLPTDDIKALKRLARVRGMKSSALLRQWIEERLLHP